MYQINILNLHNVICGYISIKLEKKCVHQMSSSGSLWSKGLGSWQTGWIEQAFLKWYIIVYSLDFTQPHE